jgi:hypothetical protein
VEAESDRRLSEYKYGKLIGSISKQFYTMIATFATPDNFPLKDSLLLDSAFSIHFWDTLQFVTVDSGLWRS